MNARRLALSVLALGLAACSSSDPTSSMSVSSGGGGGGGGPTFDAFVSVADYHFAPDTTTIAAGRSVEWSNNGPSSHTVTSDNSTWSSVTLSSPTGTDQYGSPTGGGTFLYTFSTPGTYHYHCSIHTSMTGVIVVTP